MCCLDEESAKKCFQKAVQIDEQFQPARMELLRLICNDPLMTSYEKYDEEKEILSYPKHQAREMAEVELKHRNKCMYKSIYKLYII